MSDYELENIEVTPIIPPLSTGQSFAGKAVVVRRGTDGRVTERVTLREHWGWSQKEAEEKARNEAQGWIRERRLH